ncbi:hypothetical protein M407DRAFT_10413 [Tulasnella calospora MUT 4182]|uniref:Uncharacterized protein n=1 Tax=Tulasnella calospora MUT 4182 TaxID=1051891 RepID=A0A0C3QAY6_9AGAM|nr:hypothetical protein M407DRAFT_10413 [Tulasnella calospora MUT 4182]
MSPRYLFQGGGRDVLDFISRVEALGPQNPESAVGCAHNWNTLAADLAASYLAVDALRWYEELDTATQESWVSLRASLLTKFVTDGGSRDNESDDPKYLQTLLTNEFPQADSLSLRGCRESCLAAWPAAPPLTVPGSQVVQADCVTPMEELLIFRLSLNTGGVAPSISNLTDRADNRGDKVKIQKNILRQLSTALRIGQQPKIYIPSLLRIIVSAGKQLKSNYSRLVRPDLPHTRFTNLSRSASDNWTNSLLKRPEVVVEWKLGG